MNTLSSEEQKVRIRKTTGSMSGPIYEVQAFRDALGHVWKEGLYDEGATLQPEHIPAAQEKLEKISNTKEECRALLRTWLQSLLETNDTDSH